jgi:hypothetical protein
MSSSSPASLRLRLGQAVEGAEGQLVMITVGFLDLLCTIGLVVMEQGKGPWAQAPPVLRENVLRLLQVRDGGVVLRGTPEVRRDGQCFHSVLQL